MAECSIHPGNLPPGCHWCRTGTEPGPVLPGKVLVAKAGSVLGINGWTYIGETDGAGLKFAPQIPEVDLELFRSWPPPPVTVTIKVDTSDASAKLRRLIRQMIRLIRAGKRRTHLREHAGNFSHCRTCHPEQDRRPLAVNGHEYRRQQLARQKRKNR